MPKIKYDYMDMKIISALGVYTPRRIHQTALELGIPESTLRHRIHRLIDTGMMKMSINPRYDYMGLISAIVRINYNPKYIDNFSATMKDNPYLLCLQKIYSSKPELFGFYSIPVESEKYLVHYLDNAVKLGLARDYIINWLLYFHRVNTDVKWFDPKREKWIFDWKFFYKAFIESLEKSDLSKSYIPEEEKIWSKIRDEYDVILLNAMEEYGDISLSDIAPTLNTTVQNLHYHFHKHILSEGLVESYIIHFDKFARETAIYPMFLIEFDKNEYMKLFSHVLEGAPILEFTGYIIGGNIMLQIGVIPMNIFSKYIELLDKMTSEGYIKTFNHYFMESHFLECKRSLPYRNFKGLRWKYDHEDYISKLEELGEESAS